MSALSLPGIKIDRTRDQRTYPIATRAAHAIGYVGQVSAEELAKYAVRGYREGDLIGKAGLELWGEQELAGTRGGKLTVVAPSGVISATISSLPAKQSQHIYTTLDMDVQKIAEEALGARLGAVVVLDVANGNILAIASHPTWDPNKLSRNMTVADFRALLNDPGDPLVNRAALGAFPPGSVFKVVAYTAAIEKHAGDVAQPDAVVLRLGGGGRGFLPVDRLLVHEADGDLRHGARAKIFRKGPSQVLDHGINKVLVGYAADVVLSKDLGIERRAHFGSSGSGDFFFLS